MLRLDAAARWNKALLDNAAQGKLTDEQFQRLKDLPLHVFYDGLIERRAERGSDGSWYVTTHGIGNNMVPGLATVNQWAGPKIFDALDQRMKENIQRHHGR